MALFEKGSGPWEVMTAEMRRYEYEIGPTGQVGNVAPPPAITMTA